MSKKRKADMAVDNDKELLETGMFSDVKLICQNRTWNLHRSILSRCPYFKRAFGGQFREASVRELTLEDLDPVKVYWVVFYIYTGKASPDLAALLEASTWPLRVGADLYITADFFMLDDLTNKIRRMLQVGLLDCAKKVQQLCREYRYEELDEGLGYLPDDFMDQYFSVAADAYNHGSPSLQPLRATLVRFLRLTHFATMGYKAFSEKVYEIPEFARDSMKVIFKGTLETLPGKLLPTECVECDRDADFYPDIWLNSPVTGNAEGDLPLLGYCSDCVEGRFDWPLRPKPAGEDSSGEDILEKHVPDWVEYCL